MKHIRLLLLIFLFVSCSSSETVSESVKKDHLKVLRNSLKVLGLTLAQTNEDTSVFNEYQMETSIYSIPNIDDLINTTTLYQQLESKRNRLIKYYEFDDDILKPRKNQNVLSYISNEIVFIQNAIESHVRNLMRIDTMDYTKCHSQLLTDSVAVEIKLCGISNRMAPMLILNGEPQILSPNWTYNLKFSNKEFKNGISGKLSYRLDAKMQDFDIAIP